MKKILAIFGILGLAACAGSDNDDQYYTMMAATPTVDYIERLDVYSAPHKDSFLNQLAMNYRSYAIYNARTLGDAETGELFAQKAVAAFSGETPFPESLENWPISDPDQKFALQNECRELINALKNDAADICPEAAAEAQAKYDCWLSATYNGRYDTARECRDRFGRAMAALRSGGQNCGKIAARTASAAKAPAPAAKTVQTYYPETSGLSAMARAGRAREGVVIVNNVNIPQHLINPVPVQPVVFNQNIFNKGAEGVAVVSPAQQEREEIPQLGDEYVTRDEFINMMMALREELISINRRFDDIPRGGGEKAVIKVQQIPLEPKQHIMEEIFEIRFDFDKYNIKPEYEPVIQKLVETAKASKNVRISVVGHTDTKGTADYNFALGGRRAETVRNHLIKYGIPASQIIAVSSGENDPKVPTGDGVKNAENRRVRVVKETHHVEPAQPNPMKIMIKRPDGTTAEETMYGDYFDSEEYYGDDAPLK